MISKKTIKGVDEFADALAALANELRLDEAEILKQQGRAVGRRAIDYTPMPKQHGGGRLLSNSKKVVERYFHRAAPPLRSRDWNLDEVRRAIRKRDTEALSLIMSRLLGKPIKVRAWDINIVYRAMNNRGQVPLSRAAKHTMVIEDSRYRDDLRRTKAKVGKAKGGWAAGVEHLGGRVANWIDGKKSQGRYVDLRKSYDDPSFEFINESRWGLRSDEAERIRNSAMGTAAKNMRAKLKQRADKRLQDVARKAK